MKEMHKIHHEVFEYLMLIKQKHEEEGKEFSFLLRKTNRSNYLDRGYWFLGNQHKAYISFWKNIDPNNKRPAISFVINSDGTTYLELNTMTILKTEDDVYERSFPEFPNQSNPSGKIEFNNFGSNYLQSLEHFLKIEKIKFDDLIDRNVIRPLLGYLEKISPVDFIIELSNIQDYLNQKREEFGFSRKLSSIQINNFPPIKDVSIAGIPKGNQWVVLTGENGSGKTSLLKAIATGLTSSIELADLSEFYGDYSDLQLILEISQINGDSITKIIKPYGLYEGNTLLTNGLACYGAVRLISDNSIESEALGEIKKPDNYRTYNIFKPIGILKNIVNLRYLDTSELDKTFFDFVCYQLKEIINGLIEIETQINGELLFHEVNNSKGIPFNKLPSGRRSFIALIMDLFIRFHEQQPNVSDPSNFTGIVIIDEIDIHLHPKMQVEFVKQLSETFPKIQFIVSTHSPIPLLGMPENSVFCKVSMDHEKGVCVDRLDIDISDLLPNTILSSPIFGFHDLFSVNHDENKKVQTEDFFSDVIKNRQKKEYLKDVAQKLKRNKDDI